jgi:hypothetical protein
MVLKTIVIGLSSWNAWWILLRSITPACAFSLLSAR